MMKIPQPTPAQQFIDCTDRSLFHACVGTGKTYALALQTVKAIERGINPEHSRKVVTK